MNNAAVIEVLSVTKKFRFWDDRPTTLKSLLIDLAKGKVGFGQRHEFYTLRDVSFEVRKGDFLGIMGRNGAGKSTLLKLISGIYSTTQGSIRVHEQIAPLIELGAGFHGDLSGYENIFLNAAIMVSVGRRHRTRCRIFWSSRNSAIRSTCR